MDWSRLRQRMVRRYVEERGIGDSRIQGAMLSVPRHLFVEDALRERAYGEDPLPIGLGQTISRPYIVARMTELLEPDPGDRVLEVGTGSGYQAAVLSHLAKEVYTVERLPGLTARARSIFRELDLRNIHLRTADGSVGWKDHAPFDKILVTAGARDLPPLLQEQLEPEAGILVAPVGDESGQEIVLIRMRKGYAFRKKVEACAFVPLLEGVDRMRGGAL